MSASVLTSAGMRVGAGCGLQDRVQGKMNWRPVANFMETSLRRPREVHVNKYANDRLCLKSQICKRNWFEKYEFLRACCMDEHELRSLFSQVLLSSEDCFKSRTGTWWFPLLGTAHQFVVTSPDVGKIKSRARTPLPCDKPAAM